MQEVSLFPAFERYAREARLVEDAVGNMSAKLPRILGQGKTRAEGLTLPPSVFERRSELATLTLGPHVPADVITEVESAKSEVDRTRAAMRQDEGKRRLAYDALERITAPHGTRDGKYHAGGLVLVSSRDGLEWSWSVTPYYAIVKRLPPDPDYIVSGFDAAQQLVRDLTLGIDIFERRLELSWMIARHFTANDDVPVLDVMKMYQIAAQDEKYWASPRRQFYKDLPEAAFVVNIVNWRSRAADRTPKFEFVPATLHQAHGPTARVFYLPMNPEGTEVRPMVFLRRKQV